MDFNEFGKRLLLQANNLTDPKELILGNILPLGRREEEGDISPIEESKKNKEDVRESE